MYECEIGDEPKMVRTWKVGRSQSPSKMPILASLGETAVDFDFATPTIKQDSDLEIKVNTRKWVIIFYEPITEINLSLK